MHLRSCLAPALDSSLSKRRLQPEFLFKAAWQPANKCTFQYPIITIELLGNNDKNLETLFQQAFQRFYSKITET
jgi:hypothetical protein